MTNFGWNYPPGVTGNEFAISGPDGENDADHYCPSCDEVTHGLIQWHHREGQWYICSECDQEYDLGDEEDDGADRKYEERRDDRMFGDG